MSLSRKRAQAKTKPSTPAPAAVPAVVPRALSQAQPDNRTTHIATPPQTASDIPEELVASRAYEIWQQGGCPMRTDGAEDWYAARNQLEQERLSWASPTHSDKQRGV